MYYFASLFNFSSLSPLSDCVPAVRRSSRVRRAPIRYPSQEVRQVDTPVQIDELSITDAIFLPTGTKEPLRRSTRVRKPPIRYGFEPVPEPVTYAPTIDEEPTVVTIDVDEFPVEVGPTVPVDESLDVPVTIGDDDLTLALPVPTQPEIVDWEVPLVSRKYHITIYLNFFIWK